MPKIHYGLTFSLEAVSIIAAVETINQIVIHQVCDDLAQKGRILKQAYKDMCQTYNIQSELVGHDCRPELRFEEANGLSSECLKNLVIQELGRQRICTYGTFNLCYAHTQEDLQAVIKALRYALENVKSVLLQNVSFNEQSWLKLKEDNIFLHNKLSQTRRELTDAQEKIVAMQSLHEDNAHLKKELNKTQLELSHAQEEIVAVQSLEEDNAHLKKELNKTQLELSHAQEEVVAVQSLQEDNAHLKNELNKTQLELSHAQEEIAAMKTSKFWKIRIIWFALKQKLGIKTN